MNNLSDLMRRATSDMEPESVDLFERGVRRGRTLRRRRTAFRAGAGIGAVVATAVVIGGGTYVLGGNSDNEPPPVAGTPTASRSVTKPVARPAPAEQALQTLKALLPDHLRVSRPQMHQDKSTGTIDVSVLVDDGRGPSELSVGLGSGLGPVPASLSCADRPTRCQVRPDGSAVTTGGSRPDKRDPSGLLVRSVIIQHANDTSISVVNTNTTSTTTRPTRPQPVFTHAQLLRIADSKLWKFPPDPTPGR